MVPVHVRSRAEKVVVGEKAGQLYRLKLAKVVKKVESRPPKSSEKKVVERGKPVSEVSWYSEKSRRADEREEEDEFYDVDTSSEEESPLEKTTSSDPDDDWREVRRSRRSNRGVRPGRLGDYVVGAKPPLDKHDPKTVIAYEPNSCRTCYKADNSLMVQCDSCDDWHHFVCVGVTQEVEQNSWNCCKCVTAAANQKKSSSKLESLKTKKAKKVSTKAKEKKSYKPAARRSVDKKKAKKTDEVTTGVKQRSQAGEQDVGAMQTSQKLEVVSRSVKETTANGRKDAKSVKSTSSRRSERMVLEVQLKKLVFYP
nr:uncharacterized protein LOC115260555 [Aedes albopictus]